MTNYVIFTEVDMLGRVTDAKISPIHLISVLKVYRKGCSCEYSDGRLTVYVASITGYKNQSHHVLASFEADQALADAYLEMFPEEQKTESKSATSSES